MIPFDLPAITCQYLRKPTLLQISENLNKKRISIVISKF